MMSFVNDIAFNYTLIFMYKSKGLGSCMAQWLSDLIILGTVEYN